LNNQEINGRAVTVKSAELDDSEAEAAEAAAANNHVHRDAADLGVPGLALLLDFVTPAEELELLKAMRDAPDDWQRLARRRVLHYGYEFSYAVRTSRASVTVATRVQAACGAPQFQMWGCVAHTAELTLAPPSHARHAVAFTAAGRCPAYLLLGGPTRVSPRSALSDPSP
jgi:hypothetical protein